MLPGEFVSSITSMAEAKGFPRAGLMIGGDHLGPFPWRGQPADIAMQKAVELVVAYVKAGYEKIHIDAGMPLAGDPDPLPMEVSAERTALLCRAAESARSPTQKKKGLPVYVIGAEAPRPGGSLASSESAVVTDPKSLAEFLDRCEKAFAGAGIKDAWRRVCAVVVQPGIEFGDDWIVFYNRERAATLAGSFSLLPEHMAFEIHATDFQPESSLRMMVCDHFSLLKTGPCLTHAFREAVFALGRIEDALYARNPSVKRSRILSVISRVIIADPYFVDHPAVLQTPEGRIRVFYGFRDRVRYYWNRTPIKRAMDRLMRNLEAGIPLPLVSQYFPELFSKVAAGEIKPEPASLLRAKIMLAATPYARACAG